MNDLSSAWHCSACARLHLFRDPSPRPARCEDCGTADLSDAGPTSGFGHLDAIDAHVAGSSSPDVPELARKKPEVAQLIADARRLRDEAQVAVVSLRTVLVATASACAASRQARAERVGPCP